VVGRPVEGERGAEGGDREAGSGGRHGRWVRDRVRVVVCGRDGWVCYGDGGWRPVRVTVDPAWRRFFGCFEGEPLPPPTPAASRGFRYYVAVEVPGYDTVDPCASGDGDEGGVPGVRVRGSEGGEPVGGAVTWDGIGWVQQYGTERWWRRSGTGWTESEKPDSTFYCGWYGGNLLPSPPSSPRFVMAGCWSVQTSDGWVDRIVTVAEGHHTTVDLGSDGCGHVYPRWWCDCGRCGAGWPTGHGSTTGS
jgi:hypothetical protein